MVTTKAAKKDDESGLFPLSQVSFSTSGGGGVDPLATESPVDVSKQLPHLFALQHEWLRDFVSMLRKSKK